MSCNHGGGNEKGHIAGASTIEHGDHGTAEVFKLMKEKDVAFCPTRGRR